MLFLVELFSPLFYLFHDSLHISSAYYLGMMPNNDIIECSSEYFIS
jgi:hypothetical protein